MSKQSEDMRPIYPPSIAPTAATQHTRTETGSDGSNYTFQSDGRRLSVVPMAHSTNMAENLDKPAMPPMQREGSRPSFDRARMSMDRIRPSFEQSRDFTSANRLMRLESSQSGSKLRMADQVPDDHGEPSNVPITERWKRRLTRASERSVEK